MRNEKESPASVRAGAPFHVCSATGRLFSGGGKPGSLLRLVLALAVPIITAASLFAIDVLPSCPESPNCVSSKADKSDVLHYIEPYPFLSQDKELSYNNLMKILKKNRYCTIVSSNDVLISTYFTDPYLRLKDDVFFFFDASQKVIHVYSATRSEIIYTDNGKNRERIEGIRKKYLDSVKD